MSSWLERIRPGINKFLQKRNTPDNLWIKCPDTDEMLYRTDLEAAQWVTPSGRHMRIGPQERLGHLFDGGTFETLPQPAVKEDPLNFKDDRRYTDRLRDARSKTGDDDVMPTAVGSIRKQPAVVTVQNFAFMGGSLGMAAGEAFIAAAEAAVERKSGFICYTAAGGARMQEGILSLMQMPRTTIAIDRLKRAGLPYIVVLTDPTTGGVTASYAMLGDIHIAEPGALIGFAGPRVIEQTIRQTLPEGFQRSEYLRDKGMVDMVVDRREHREVLGRLLNLLMGRPQAA